MNNKNIKHISLLKKMIPFACSVLSFLIGWLWYSPFLFGKFWQAIKAHKEVSTKSMLISMGIHFVILNMVAYGIYILVHRLKLPKTLKAGAYFGLTAGLLFVATSLATVYAYSGNIAFLTLWAIDSGYQTIALTITGAILNRFSRV